MSKLMLYASVALMLGATVAEAQDQSRQRPGGDRPSGPEGAGPGRPGGGNNPGGPGGGRPGVVRPMPGGPQVQPPRPGYGGPQIQPPRPGRPGDGGPQIQPPRPGYGGRPPVVRPRPPHGGNWNRPPIHAQHFRYPRGHNYRRWNIGLLLPSIFLTSAYYYNDYGQLGLNAPPRNYRWVRYGPDLLLVNRRTGKIRDVRYGVFR